MEELHLTNYKLTPSVVEVGRPTEITISPRGDNVYFSDDAVYLLDIHGVADATGKLNGAHGKRRELRAENGVLRFTETFEREQQYALKLTLPEEQQYCSNPYYQPPAHGRVPRPKDQRYPVLYLYALESDLYCLRPYKGDFHLHSSDSDGHESSCGVLANMRRAGFDFSALTNHYWFHSAEKVARLWKGLPDVFTVLPGEEVHVPSEYLHAVAVGGTKSVNDFYYRNREACDREIDAIAGGLDLPETIDAHNYASRIWVADKIREFGGLSILVHPHWIWFEVYFMPEDLTIKLLESGVYDVLELLNGGSENRLQVAMYFEERAKGFDPPIVGSSDCHLTDQRDERFPTQAFTYVFAENRSPDGIRKAILAHRTVAVEKNLEGRDYQIYGGYRLVKYANFLMQNYNPVYTELCYPQGTLMREYEKEPSPETARLLLALYERSEAFARAFFGRREPEETGDTRTGED
ncbi:MAG: hypothetical protein KIG36_05995 [Eubacteriales bacterium]|nr:hypothetical protein [Eubacteriales bacterium]